MLETKKKFPAGSVANIPPDNRH